MSFGSRIDRSIDGIIFDNGDFIQIFHQGCINGFKYLQKLVFAREVMNEIYFVELFEDGWCHGNTKSIGIDASLTIISRTGD